uniref:Zinc finger CHCC-type domain-containing protein n=1 Tax=Aureoumbra lagunensis TaxID=44058 RepID=A0A7S3JV71_9STRA|mmetsp:Transcript_13055/g.17462  ORF Transcript_13055/g.17462 Transcript_13055/m.17462 type:complete len:111 (+) Transcript_13055:38-370(+)
MIAGVRTAAVRTAGRTFSRPIRPRCFQGNVRMMATAGANSVKYWNPHRSNAEELINKVEPIKVKGDMAVCNGGGGALGHPLEYIQLNTVDPTKPAVCLYCGLRFIKDTSH